ncbi:protein MULTIPLE CHLOROPLAST DIVISION SITE 1-like isoform X2 [Hibiscus syriacus]|uniref:protein MULTIPLE CHLOROPLAST DIVISION SITE 1-like isoform X2 n=1 Tax=Hibiscus syriacus TaxID=106335 RepID=UPI0019240C31|nr:protein MULTIPLE CHLOROPLAST DIVISION SITE 1-like isoform X2 [Hibiscus syriacus]
MASIWLLQLPSLPFQHRVFSNGTSFLLHRRHCLSQRLNWIPLTPNRTFFMRAVNGPMSSEEDNCAHNEVVDRAKSTLVMKIFPRNYFTVGLCITIAIMVVALRAYAERKPSQSHPGSVADLVRRGQLRPDRRGVSRPLNYDDPFNNPLVKVGKSNSTVEMCGKQYRLAPVNLTKEQQAVHQKRRSRAYQWKRTTVFLKEGDSIPADVDPDAIRWIPANHPFATTASDIDEDLVQNNVYQQCGVPFRIQAEHDALQRKLEALQKEEKLNNLLIDSRNAKDFQRPFKLNDWSEDPVEQGPINNSRVETKPTKTGHASDSIESDTSSEEMKQP